MQAKISAASSLKESKFDALKDRVMDEITRKFQINRVNFRFRYDLNKEAPKLFHNAEAAHFDLESNKIQKEVLLKEVKDTLDNEYKRRHDEALKELERTKKINELE